MRRRKGDSINAGKIKRFGNVEIKFKSREMINVDVLRDEDGCIAAVDIRVHDLDVEV